MGHASSIALGLALQREDKRFWVFDGDGAVLMHMGAMPVIGSQSPKNLVHVVLNNGTHDTVGGQPTCMPNVKLFEPASACEYSRVLCANDEDTLLTTLSAIKEGEPELTFLEICVATGTRADLGRPTSTPGENKASLMKCLCGLEGR